MELQGWQAGLHRVCEWIMRLLIVNLLWIGFTIMGLVIFGFFPATAAMFAVVRKWVMNDNDVPIFRTFVQVYRSEFVKVNGLGLILAVFAFTIYFYLDVYQFDSGFIFLITRVVLFVSIILFYAQLMYFFPTYVHYKLPFFQYLKMPIIFALSSPFRTIFMVIMAFGIYMILTNFPGLQPFLAGSTLSLICMFIAYQVFSKFEPANLNI